MGRQEWRKSENNLVSIHKKLQDMIRNNSAMVDACNNYASALNKALDNLQWQFDKNIITNKNDLEKCKNNLLDQFHHDLLMIDQKIHANVEQAINNNQDLTDLSNTQTMDQAMTDPYSIVSQNAMDTMAAEIAAETDQQTQVLQAQIQEDQTQQQQVEEEDQTQQQAATQTESEPDEDLKKDLEKGAVVIGALKAVDELDPVAAKKVTEDAFHDITGNKDTSFDYLKNAGENEKESLERKFDPAPKPTPPTE